MSSRRKPADYGKFKWAINAVPEGTSRDNNDISDVSVNGKEAPVSQSTPRHAVVPKHTQHLSLIHI